MVEITTAEDFRDFVASVEKAQGYVRPRAFGIGVARLSGGGHTLDTWYPVVNHEENYGTAAALAVILRYQHGQAIYEPTYKQLKDILGCFKWCEDDINKHPNVRLLKKLYDVYSDQFKERQQKRLVVCFIPPAEEDKGPSFVSDAYLRLHLLSHTKVVPNSINLDGIFSVLPNNYWTNKGPVAPEDMDNRRFVSMLGHYPLSVHSLDKFPRMIDYVVPDGVRIGDANRVRLGAYLGKGVTVMHEGFVNFNAGAEGPNMIEGRISQGVFVKAHSDIGGGASIMGTLSGGGKEKISIGEHCLIGANAGTGISLGDYCTIEAGLYITASTKVLLENGQDVKAYMLTGQNEMLFIRDSRGGKVKMLRRKNSVKLNEELHKNTTAP